MSWKSTIHRGLAPFDLPLNVASQIEIDLDTECWNWTGHIQFGYGRVRAYGKRYQAHRFVYRHILGMPLPTLHLDHLCLNKRCCNPAHLEPVTAYENARRADGRKEGFCIRGHPREKEGYYSMSAGGWKCRACVRLSYARNKKFKL